MTTFWTLLGPDFSGKSTALGRLQDEHGWQVVSHDARFSADHPLIAKLKGAWIDDGLRWLGRRYTPELVLSVMHTVVLYLRDQIDRQSGTGPIIVDSFYYKQLAACSLLGVAHEPTFDYWRSFPQPEGVVYLDVPPEVAWERTGRGAAANAYEHYGDEITREGFVRLQTDLRATMLAEVGDLPLTVIDASESSDAVLAKIVAAVGEPTW
jgi:thymidylate kinase